MIDREDSWGLDTLDKDDVERIQRVFEVYDLDEIAIADEIASEINNWLEWRRAGLDLHL